jgi:pilus assembly protein CpaC
MARFLGLGTNASRGSRWLAVVGFATAELVSGFVVQAAEPAPARALLRPAVLRPVTNNTDAPTNATGSPDRLEVVGSGSAAAKPLKKADARPVMGTPVQPSAWMQDINEALGDGPSLSPQLSKARKPLLAMPKEEATPADPVLAVETKTEPAPAEAPVEPKEPPVSKPTTRPRITAKLQDESAASAQAPTTPIKPSARGAKSLGTTTAVIENAEPAFVAQAPAAGPVDLTNPFELINESGEIAVMVRRSKLMRTKVNIYRTAVVDSGVVEVVQFTPQEISLIGKSTGTTHVTFWFEQEGAKPITYLVRVEPDVERVKELEDQYRLLEDVINEMYPNSKIELLVVADKLIIKGQAKDGEEAGEIISLVRSQSGGGGGGGGGSGGYGGFGGGGSLGEGVAANVLADSATGNNTRARLSVINMLRVPGIQQVSLRVKIAELTRSAGRGFGVSVKGNVNLTNNPNGSKLILNSLAAAAGGTGSAIIAQVDGDDLSFGLKYLQQTGVIRLLSEPTLVTMSGRPAQFHAGGEFAVPTLIGGAGVNAVTTDFRAFGAVINFLPTVLDKDRIRLTVSPEFSKINTGLAVGGTPGLDTRSVTTTVEMREGQTLAIAGLIDDNMSANKRGDLPFVSWLFGDRTVTHNETELIMLVTPDLVHPMDPEEVPPLPGFDVTEPTNAQFFFQGRLEGNPTYDYRGTVWPRLRKRYGGGGSAMISGPFGHGQ